MALWPYVSVVLWLMMAVALWPCGSVALWPRSAPVLASARPGASLGLRLRAHSYNGPQVAHARLAWSAGRVRTVPVELR